MEDSRLCFGLFIGPFAFDSISNLVYWVLTDIYGLLAVNYLDNFIVIAYILEESQIAQNIVIIILRYLGFCINMEIRLPYEKLEKLIKILCQ